MITGIGNDIIEIERVKKACQSEAFLARFFTEEERKKFAKKPQSLAGNFAVKEAVVKVFGTGFRNIDPIEIEVLRDEFGKPYVELYGKAKEFAKLQKIDRIFVSISNLQTYASAVAVGERDERE